MKENCFLVSLKKIVDEVIEGKWGSGNERINRLRKAGCDPKIVQKEVNKQFLR